MTDDPGGGGAAPPERFSFIDDLLAPWCRPDAPGLVVAVSRAGRPIYRRAVGAACLAQGLAMTPATRLRIGSTSKQFTAMLALLLSEEGLLDLDAPLTRWLPEVACPAGEPTLRQCLHHTSGLRCVQEVAFLAAGLTIQPPGRHLPAYARQSAANFAPGEVQLYSNGGYHLVSRAIERVTGAPFEQVLQERLLQPLGLQDTFAERSDMAVVAGLAALHTPDPARPGAWRKGLLPNEETLGEGGIVSTADDLLRWAAHLRQALDGHPRVGRPDSWQALVTSARTRDGLSTAYAMGLFVHEWRGLRVWRHPGAVIGGASELLLVPELGLDIAILSNGAPVSPSALAYAIAQGLAPRPLPAAPPPASSEGLGHLFGRRYHCAGGLVLGFGDVAGMLGVSLQGSPPAPVLRDLGDELAVGFEDLAMGPFRLPKSALAPGDDAVAPARLVMHESGHAHAFTLLPAAVPQAAEMGAELAGRYHSPDMEAQATIAWEGEGLRMRWLGGYGTRQLWIEPLSREVALLAIDDPQAPGHLVMTVEREGPRVAGFHVSAGRTRCLRFRRLADNH